MKSRFLIIILCLILLTSCSDNTILPQEVIYTFNDALGREVSVKSLDSVVVLSGSFAEAWIDGGGSVSGTTSDAVEERGLEIDTACIVGSIKSPDAEKILSLEPTLVILSADIENHKKVGGLLDSLDVPIAYLRLDSFEDYLQMLKISSELNQRHDLYEENGLKVREEIEKIVSQVPDKDIDVLLLRAYSSGIKAKTQDNLAGIILNELGTRNIASEYPLLLDDLSLEEILKRDPNYIFAVPMGDEEKAYSYIMQTFESNTAWSTLSAIKNSNFVMLPKDLFHYKPNSRWAESYLYLAQILYPEIYK